MGNSPGLFPLGLFITYETWALKRRQGHLSWDGAIFQVGSNELEFLPTFRFFLVVSIGVDQCGYVLSETLQRLSPVASGNGRW